MAESHTKRVLDVGQCGFDGPRLGRFLTRGFNCIVDRAGTKAEAEALAARHPYDLVLVNRILDRDRSPGIDVIAALHAAHPALRLMLVSDRADAQEEAIKHGAIKGFGKAALESQETLQLLGSMLNQNSS